jgi:hypothetical protein
MLCSKQVGEITANLTLGVNDSVKNCVLVMCDKVHYTEEL